MNDRIFKQMDDEWRNLPYPTYSSSFGDNGCGCCACVHVAIEQEAKKNWDIEDLRGWMCDQGFAVPGHGTEWEGIVATLEHIGHKNVVWVKRADPMSKAWEELDKGNRIGVLLVDSSNTPDGTYWTSSGHYVAFNKYWKDSDGRRWFNIKDSGTRGHDGEFCYERSIKGALPQLFIVERIDEQPTPTPTPTKKPYTGQYPNPRRYLEYGDKGTEVGKLQDYLNWYYDGEFYKKCGGRDNIYGPNTLRYCNRMLTDFFGASEADGKVGPKTIAKMKEYGANPTPQPKPEPTPTPTTDTLVIDVSDFQSAIDWAKAKADGVQGVIVKCGFRHGEGGALDEDSMFMTHIKGAHNAGLPIGIYFFTEAISAAEGKEEAQYAIKLWQKAGVPISYPIGIDSEEVFWKNPDGSIGKGRANSDMLSAAKRTEAIKAFAEEINRQGYRSMLYASTNWLYNQVDMSVLSPIMDVWCAQWASSCGYTGKYVMWQYSSEGKVNGVKGNVDMNHCYIEPKKIDPPKPSPAPTPDPKPYAGPYPTAAEIKIAQVNGMRQACREQTSWSYSSINEFENNPTIEKSRKKSTCVTYVSCVLQRTGVLRSGDCLWHDGTGFGDGRVRGMNGQMEVTYYINKKTLKDIPLEPCDILFYDDNKSGEMGNGGHEEIFNGTRGSNKLYFYSGGTGSYHNTSNNNSEPDSRKVLAVVRIKWRTYIKKGDEGDAVTKLQNYLDWYFDGAFFKECGPADGIFGPNTYKWTVKMQTDLFGAAEADGYVGPKTITEMKEVRK